MYNFHELLFTLLRPPARCLEHNLGEIGIVGNSKVILRDMREERNRHVILDSSFLGSGYQHHRGSMTFNTVECTFSGEVLLIDIDCSHS